MIRFITRFAIFVSPIVVMQIFTVLFYNRDGGDLLRVGYIFDKIPHTHLITDNNKIGKHFEKITNIKTEDLKQFDILTIGDSFAEQDTLGFQNYLGSIQELSILHINQKVHNNEPLQLLSNLINGDFFDSTKVKYVIYESIERYYCKRALKVDTTKKTSKSELMLKTDNLCKEKKKKEKEFYFFSNRIIQFTLNNILYIFDDNAISSQVYKVELDRPHFSNSKKELLFIYDDIDDGVIVNNNKENLEKANEILNNLSFKLKQKGIKLIVIAAVDKYDYYYDHIKNKKDYIRPIFFEHYKYLNRNYEFINSKEVLKDTIKNKLDVFHYGDTHWSPLSSMNIAKDIKIKLK